MLLVRAIDPSLKAVHLVLGADTGGASSRRWI